MRIAFLQREWFENIGIMTLAAGLNAAGHEVEVFVDNAESDIASAVNRFTPGLICFSCTTGEHLWALAAARRLKKIKNIFTVFGGHHPTFFPQIINQPGVDAICRGEGEFALKELVEALISGESPAGIHNLWVKHDREITRNELRPLIQDLDSLPLPLRSVYDKYPRLQANTTKHFMASRGCPCSCSYCYAHPLRELYRGKGPFVRYRSPGAIIREIRLTMQKYPLKTVFLDDDILTFNKPWLYEFLDLYREEVCLPFICNVWAAWLDEATCRRLAEAGCFRVSMGVETGDDHLRQKILKKNITNAQIIAAAENLHRYGIRVLTNNMIGLPGETIDQALETMRLNTRIRTDYPWCSILQPYPGTPIADTARAAGLLTTDTEQLFASTFFKTSILQQKNMPKLVRLHKFFFLGVKFPFLIPIIKFLIKLPLNPLYDLIFLSTFALRYRRANRLSWPGMIHFGCRNIRLYLKSLKINK